jgi:hypothetical protein
VRFSWYKRIVNEGCVFEHEVPTELHLEPSTFPLVGRLRGMSRAFSSIVGNIRRAQDSDDKSLCKILTELFSRSLGGN